MSELASGFEYFDRQRGDREIREALEVDQELQTNIKKVAKGLNINVKMRPYRQILRISLFTFECQFVPFALLDPGKNAKADSSS